MKLNPMNTAPKDRPILLDLGLPWIVYGAWNGANGEWSYANMQTGLYGGEWSDTYFETEYEKEPLGWLPLPSGKSEE